MIGVEVARAASSCGPRGERASSADAGPMLEAHGVFLAVNLEVTNAGLEPIDRFPWWQLRLRDDKGRVFTPQTDATASYEASQQPRQRPEDYQPGIAYDEVVVYDVPPGAGAFTLESEDGTLNVPLPPSDPSALGTPLA